MCTTLEKRPEDFWYFNSGITVFAKAARRAMAGGSSNDFGTFHLDDMSVVNGAQTVGTIGKYGESSPELLSNVAVPIRIIVRGDNQFFGEEVTRTNNRQNRIENRDFVALDPEQTRVKTEPAIDGIDYQLMRSESVTRSETSRKRGGNYRTHPIATHGNRVIATLVFSDLPVTRFKDSTFDLEKVADEAHVTAMVDKSLAALSAEVQKLFPNAIIPTLFKNQKKCEILYERVRKA
jgi:AIPR protein